MKHMTAIPNVNKIERKWYLIDAKGKKMGQIAPVVAKILQGKNHAYYSPFLDCGDNVVIINAKDIAIDQKVAEAKTYYRYSGYPGGLRSLNLGQFMKKNPEKVLEYSIKGMLPKNKLGKKMFGKLHIYRNEAHTMQDKQFEQVM